MSRGVSKTVLAGLTADQAAAGLIAACRLTGVNPVVAGSDKGNRSRQLTCVALITMIGSRYGLTGKVAQLLRANPTRLAPSGVRAAGHKASEIIAVTEALFRAGFNPGWSDQTPAIRLSMAIEAGGLEADEQAPTTRLTRDPNLTPFDPASLGRRGKIAKVAPKYDGRTSARADDVRVGSEDSLRRMFDGDDRLVKACRQAGGFPIVMLKGPYAGALRSPDAKTWGHA